VGYDKLRDKVSNFFNNMSDKSEHFIHNFIKQYAPKEILPKKREAKAKLKGLNVYEDPPSDFDC